MAEQSQQLLQSAHVIGIQDKRERNGNRPERIEAEAEVEPERKCEPTLGYRLPSSPSSCCRAPKRSGSGNRAKLHRTSTTASSLGMSLQPRSSVPTDSRMPREWSLAGSCTERGVGEGIFFSVDFTSHSDLRRNLPDNGFEGHPV